MGFFDKIKRGVNVGEENPKKASSAKTKKKADKKTKPKKSETLPAKTPTETKEELKSPQKIEQKKEKLQPEGELAIDVYETNGNIVVQSTIGGIKAEDLDISIEGDMVTVRGSRDDKIEKEGKKYFYQECYWGSFMRKVILPEEVDGSQAKASMKDGVLSLVMPKLHRKKKRKIAVKEEE